MKKKIKNIGLANVTLFITQMTWSFFDVTNNLNSY